VFGDVGGTSSIVATFLSFLASPISQLLFRIKMLRLLFIAKTKNNKIFKPSNPILI
jgi:hypothetical protein